MQFNTNFFTTDLMNHCEFLKRMMRLRHDDEVLLIPLLDAMASRGEPLAEVVPFYGNHQSLTKNPVNIARMYSIMRGLTTHSFNVFEAAQLDPEDTFLHAIALATAALQWVIFLILLWFNAQQYEKLSKDVVVWVVTVGTTFFFTRQCMGEWTSCSEFQNFGVAMGRSECSLMRICNEANNKLLGVLVSLFNIYFMLLSTDPNDAIMNALALYFVLTFDSMAMPNWDESRLFDELAINCHDYIMEPLLPADLLSVTREVSKQSLNSTGDSWDGHFSDDDKLYIQVKRVQNEPFHEESTLTVEILVHRQVTPAHFDTVVYRCQGLLAEVNNFFDCVHKFDCVEKFRDIHD